MSNKPKHPTKQGRRNALQKDFLREIQKSLGRFLSIFLIVALGVGLFAGISSTESDMIRSGDKYADEYRLMDLKVVSSYGMTEEDVAALQALPSVESALGSYSFDVLTPIGDDMSVIHLLSHTEDMNMLTLAEGRLPASVGECVVDLDLMALAGYSIGDTISLKSGTDDALEDTLSRDSLTIVGSVTTPLYFSVIRESSAIGNGSVKGYVVVQPELFTLDVYTEAYITVQGAREATAFTDEYDRLIDQALEEISQIEDIRCQIRRDDLAQQILVEIEEARNELDDKQSEAQQEIQENEQLLIDAQQDWLDGIEQLEDAQEQIAQGWEQYNTGLADLETARQQWSDANAELRQNQQALAQAKTELDAAIVDAEQQKQDLNQQLAEVNAGIAELNTAISELSISIIPIQDSLNTLDAEIDTLYSAYSAAQQELDSAESALSQTQQQIADLETEIAALEASLADLSEAEQEQVRGQIQELEAQLAQAQEQIPTLTAQRDEAQEQLTATETPLYEKLQEQSALQEQLDALNANLAKLENAKAEAVQNQTALENGIAQIDSTINAYTAEYEQNRQALEDAQAQLNQASAEIQAAQRELEEAKQTLEEMEQELQEAQQELDDAQQEIQDGQQQLQEAQNTLDSEVQDAQQEILDAEDQASNLELPIWYTFDRSLIPEYKAFGDNAQRLAALAVVFPSIFFLVAAMISLTTMTRMVEEQRLQIGTLKALGYSNWAIMGKFFNYALLSTLGGSILGVLVGEKLFPFILISAYYSTVYTHIPYILLPYQWGYGLAATFAACFCTGGAALMACYRELLAHPAVLMRPATPNSGKRTLVERIPFLWQMLNFSWKSSIRNLFRYKKRFFMTLFGIGGCMALLMVGFGLRDSITSIVDHQYGALHLYDGTVTYSSTLDAGDKADIQAFLSEHPQVDGYLDSRMGVITLHSDTYETDSYLVVLENADNVSDFLLFRDRATQALCPLDDSGIILTEKAASLLGVSVGDTIQLSEEGVNVKTAVISAICENYAAHYIYMTPQAYESIYGQAPEWNNLFFRTGPDASDAEIQAIGEALLDFEAVLGVQYTSATEAQLMGMVISMNLIMVALIVVAGLLSFVVLYNLNNINITERRRELATLKVLGFHDIEVANYVYRENLLLTVFGIAIGCFLGKYLHYFTVITIEADTAMFGREIAPISYLFGVLLTLAFSGFVNWLMYFKLKKIDMVESLKSVE